MNDFERWWYDEGSSNRPVDEDIEEFSKRMCQIAWSNGAFKEREKTAQQEPFGYFKAGPFGWTNCAETDEGAIPLYQLPKDLT